MIQIGVKICPKCGGKLYQYGRVERIVRSKNRETSWVSIRRMRCEQCGGFHRELPEYIFPYKQYEKEVIQGVVDGLITSETLGYENYPCEMTMQRWIAYFSHSLTE